MKKREEEVQAIAGEVEEMQSGMVVAVAVAVVDGIGNGWSTMQCFLAVVEELVVLAGAGGSSGKDPPPMVALVVAVAVVVAVSCIREAASAVGNRPCLGVHFALCGF